MLVVGAGVAEVTGGMGQDRLQRRGQRIGRVNGPVVLQEHRHQARDGGRGHGGAAEAAVVIVREGGGNPVIAAALAAAGHDLRLDAAVVRGAPATEAGHGAVIRVDGPHGDHVLGGGWRTDGVEPGAVVARPCGPLVVPRGEHHRYLIVQAGGRQVAADDLVVLGSIPDVRSPVTELLVLGEVAPGVLGQVSPSVVDGVDVVSEVIVPKVREDGGDAGGHPLVFAVSAQAAVASHGPGDMGGVVGHPTGAVSSHDFAHTVVVRLEVLMHARVASVPHGGNDAISRHRGWQ